jgi:ectoine hydroxylase-related dioxygenase (phytanoyl-CoA dioxygenase family)
LKATDARFDRIASGSELGPDAERQLLDSGFLVVPGAVGPERIGQLARAYDSVIAAATPPDLRTGSDTTRVHGLVSRGAEFDELYVHPAVLEACCRVIGQPFRLSSLLARTVRPRSKAQSLHVDAAADAEGWPMVGFIFMMDDFGPDNGSTRFVPGSHRWARDPRRVLEHPSADYPGQALACGTAGSVVVYNASVWHGHSANRSGRARRSIQGAYVRRSRVPGTQEAAGVGPVTTSRLGPLARYVLAIQSGPTERQSH